jgi:voltage-gated potassium channel
MESPSAGQPGTGWRHQLHEIIFEADTPTGKVFDVALIWLIILSVIAVMLESVASIRASYGPILRVSEWVFTVLFTIEYVLRLLCVRKAWRYAVSFFGVVDLMAILPTYLSLLFPGGQALLVLRGLRLLRTFRVFKLAHHVKEAGILLRALRATRYKFTVFMATVLTLVLVLGSLIYLVEGAANGFTSIPRSIYWAIVTVTTVGYGDIAPQTNVGQFLAAIAMLLGYAIIAVPTGIVTVELGRQSQAQVTTQSCRHCSREGHEWDASHCKYCGWKL